MRRGPAELEALSYELAPRMEDESTLMTDLQLLGKILLPMPEAALDPQQVDRFLDEEDLDPTDLVAAPGEEFDEAAMRFCRTHVEAKHWEKVAQALIAKVPFYLDSTDHLRAILTGLIVLENRRESNLVGIMLFRDAVLKEIDDMVGNLVRSLENRQRARPSTKLGTLLQDFVESKGGQRLTRLLQDSAAGRALSAQLEQDLDTAYQEVARLMASGDFPIAPPWAIRLVTMQCTTEHVLDLLNDNAGAEISFVERLQGKLHEDDVRLVATEIDKWLASHDEHLHKMAMEQMALLCHTGSKDVLVTWALCTIEELSVSYASSLEEEVVFAGTNASVDEVEALASAYDDWGYPAIADRIRHHQLEVLENIAAAADSVEAGRADHLIRDLSDTRGTVATA